MEGTHVRDRSRSPIHLRDNDDEDHDDTGRFDKSRFDSKSNDGIERSFSRDRNREKKIYNNKSCCKVYVSNIPSSFTWQTIKDLMKNKVGMVDFVDTFDDERHCSRGCALVVFRSKELAELALETKFERPLRLYSAEEALNQRDFEFLFQQNSDKKRNISDRIQRRDVRPGEHRTPIFPDNEETYGVSISVLRSLNIGAPLVNRIFVANIDFKSSEADLESVFQIAGPVKKVELSRDPEGNSRGFAVVEFEHPVHAVQAISMFNNQKYFGREMCIRMDRETRPKNNSQQSSNLPPGLHGVGAGLGQNGTPVFDITQINNTAPRDGGGPSSFQGFPMSMGNNFNDMGMNMNNMNPMGSMNNSVNQNPMGQDGYNNLGQNQMELNNPLQIVHNLLDNFRSGNSNIQQGGMPGFNNSGFGMGGGNRMGSDFNRASGAVSRGNGMTNNSSSRFNDRIGTMRGFDTSDGSASFEAQNRSVGGFSGSNQPRIEVRSNLVDFKDGSRGSNTRFEGRRNSEGSCYNSPNVVTITNLPSDYTWQNLRDLCHDYGDVRFAEITGPGVGSVRFGSRASANTAVDLLDQQRFDGKLLQARLM